MLLWCLTVSDSSKEEFLCLSSLVNFLNKSIIKQIQEEQFAYVIWNQKVSHNLSKKGCQREKMLFFGRCGYNYTIILGKILIQKNKETVNNHHGKKYWNSS